MSLIVRELFAKSLFLASPDFYFWLYEMFASHLSLSLSLAVKAHLFEAAYKSLIVRESHSQ